MKKAFEEAKIEKISVSVADIVKCSGDDPAGSFNLGGNASQGWDDISGSKV